MKALYILVTLLSMSSLPLAAEQVESVAGTLKDRINDTGITTLTVTGTINAADIEYINNTLTDLSSLDLSGCTIEAYTGAPLASGRNASPADALPEYSLTGSRITTISLPRNLKSLEEGCLAASAITSLILPTTVEAIGTAACDGCRSLATVTLPPTVTAIPPLAFKGCTSLTDLQLSPAITTIGREAFKGCTSLKSVLLPDPIRTIGDEAFSNCSSLSTINFPASLTAIGAEAFNEAAITEADLSACSSLRSVGDWAFGHCRRLASVALPESLTGLAPYLFKGASLTATDGIIHNNLETIGDYALYGNDQVATATLPASVTSLGDKAMARMSSLSKLDATAVTELPELGENVFAGTSGDDVILLASDDMAPVFKATPQWQEFNITVDPSTSAINPVIDRPDDKIEMRYDGNTLYIKASRPVDSVTLTDMQGRTIARTSVAGSHTAEVATPASTTRAVIVTILFSDATVASIKTLL